jgi:hypothetical protein
MYPWDLTTLEGSGLASGASSLDEMTHLFEKLKTICFVQGTLDRSFPIVAAPQSPPVFVSIASSPALVNDGKQSSLSSLCAPLAKGVWRRITYPV